MTKVMQHPDGVLAERECMRRKGRAEQVSSLVNECINTGSLIITAVTYSSQIII